MKTTKSFLNAVNEDLVRLNVRYSNVWKVATMQDNVAGKRALKTHVAVVYVCERIDSEPEFWIYYNYDTSMGNNVSKTTRKTSKEADEEFANTLV